jgi:ATP-dependent DNA helicase RecG
MEPIDILELIPKGESSFVQFKERIDDAHKFSQELVAFSNSKGGLIIIGVNDETGDLNGLSFTEIRDTNRLIVASSTNNVKPAIIVESETINIKEDSLIIVHVGEGLSKPYKDKNGAIWVKNGSDKRRVLSNDEIARLLQDSKVTFADEMVVRNTFASDIDIDSFEKFIYTRQKKSVEQLGVGFKQSLVNLNILKDDNLTLAGLLLFCESRHKFKPQFSIQCVAVHSSTILGNEFDDYEPAFEGNMLHVYEQTMSFIERNLKKVPIGNSFNSQTEWEIPHEVFEELIVNALIHRDYFINTTIKVFIFSDRIEIVSPGRLPNSLTIENVLSGLSIPRNPILQSLAQHILPYKGLGTGIRRTILAYPDIEFKNIIEKEQFIASIKRP